MFWSYLLLPHHFPATHPLLFFSSYLIFCPLFPLPRPICVCQMFLARRLPIRAELTHWSYALRGNRTFLSQQPTVANSSSARGGTSSPTPSAHSILLSVHSWGPCMCCRNCCELLCAAACCIQKTLLPQVPHRLWLLLSFRPSSSMITDP